MPRYQQAGSGHIVIIAVILIAGLGTLGYVAYQRFFAQRDVATPQAGTSQSLAETPAQPRDEVIQGLGVMDTYVNHQLGFSFEFPKQTAGNIGCKATNQWNDNYGNTVQAPVTLYVMQPGTADMTVLAGENKFTITQKRAPMYTEATYGADRRSYNATCTMTDVTQQLLDDHKLDWLMWRAWQVYKINSADQIPQLAQGFDGAPLKDYVSSISYTLGQMANGRQPVDVHYNLNREGVIGTRMVTWYYPKQKLLVHIDMGQSESFQDITDSNKFYGEDVLNSFKVL